MLKLYPGHLNINSVLSLKHHSLKVAEIGDTLAMSYSYYIHPQYKFKL